LEEHNPSEYQNLDNLKDEAGGSVDVVVETVYNLHKSDTENYDAHSEIDGSLAGVTNVQPANFTGSDPNSESKRKSYLGVKTKKYGNFTESIYITGNLEDPGRTLAHEGGHAIYNAENMTKYSLWRSTHNSPGGHGRGDEGGELADKLEAQYVKNQNKRK
jgi:hypothetical protein